MSFGGGGSSDDAFLIGPFLDWWEKRNAKRDAKRTAKAEAKAARQAEPKGGPPQAT
jgi:hypothetical protein